MMCEMMPFHMFVIWIFDDKKRKMRAENIKKCHYLSHIHNGNDDVDEGKFVALTGNSALFVTSIFFLSSSSFVLIIATVSI